MQTTNRRLLKTLHSVFVPLTSLFLKNGVKAEPVIGMLKVAFVETARDEHGKGGRPASVNKISALTGFSRSHVARLLEESTVTLGDQDVNDTPEADILALWISSDHYVDKFGQPRVLDLGPGSGSFTELVKAATGDDSITRYLGRLQQAKCVEFRDDDRVAFLKREYYMGDDLARLIAIGLVPLLDTMATNWDLEPGRGLIQRVAQSKNIDPRKVGSCRRIIQQMTANFIQDLDDLLCNMESLDDEPARDADGKQLSRFGVGAYYFEMPN